MEKCIAYKTCIPFSLQILSKIISLWLVYSQMHTKNHVDLNTDLSLDMWDLNKN
jgi:hypothetical protein